jgi:hypothetical protein
MLDPLAVYLNDHLAGARFAVELLAWLREARSNPALRDFAERLLGEIDEDRSVLQQLSDDVGAVGSSMKEAASWLAEKASRLKLRLNNDTDFSTLEAIEMLALGVLGKMKLWQALAVIKNADTRLQQMDFDLLIARAKSQHDELETYRLNLATPALSSHGRTARSP